ncbi:putative mediator of RNA polymerase II transcription subunit 26a [Dendrobium catenatum]|uniref:Putative mediator of RNA polymerase II transcription subunit 26a n=1 Tax=Dendrobium catenatum TaxID=906689 RepID=A0A2I0X6R5_9ASPA|nr:putative mediator of RNA polymerase II transcription subunit 26a [Dendrobium catenatum]
MADAKQSLDYWRKYFNCAKSDIFDLIHNAIVVAAVDCPKEFKNRKNLIVEKLYTSLIVREVVRLKRILSHKRLYESDSDFVLYESLRSLQMMQLSAEILNSTEIGRTVSALQKHNSNQIQKLVRSLIDGWKILVDESVKSGAPIVENITTDSINNLKKSSITDSEFVCSSKLTSEQKPCNHLSAIVKRKHPEEVSEMLKLEVAKKKLREGYQRIENAKRQRMIQIIEPIDLPKLSHEKRRSRKKVGKDSWN